MTDNEFKEKERELEKQHKANLHKIRKKYVEANAEFKVGDFIGNVTGIIKVNSISYEWWRTTVPEIVYKGYRYKKLNGELLRTKNDKQSSLMNQLKKITV